MSTRPPSRYGSEQGTWAGKAIAVIAVIFALVAAVFLYRYVTQRANTPVEVSMVTQERIDDSTLRVWVDITRKDPAQESYCIVTALNYQMAEVGRREIIMPTGGEKVTRVAADIPTRDVPVAGGVYGCSTGLEPYMDVDNRVTTL
ncbi:DUF4307 domain-containing protein [Corynebacterium tapiri]|uniref:DUF4307 domain-containing protein n=1 Tax=Corynebacterium tapiri TaxID=1448266 RepID=A0A5C4U7P7_9CORY|nr:DUF4307 domain-containing protein [Corynebacterium tapiri]TNM00493.1 DUF4307 domain-containing protein [Corynebacterium tapiri]